MDTTRPASYLPAVKCSSCRAEIEISSMSDHICLERRDESRPVRAPRLNHKGANEQTSSRGRNSPVNDAEPTALALAHQHYTLAAAVGQEEPDILAVPSSSGRLSSHPKLLRSRTAPVPRLYEPFSADLPSNLDCAFPPFPKKRFPVGRSQVPVDFTPTSPAQSPSRFSNSDPLLAQSESRTTGSAKLLRRMNSIVPGPFDMRKLKEEDSERVVQGTKIKGHSRTPTASSNGSTGRSPSYDRNAYWRRPSIATSDKSSSSPRSRDSRPPVRLDGDGQPLPSRPAPPRPVRPDTLEGFLEQLKEQDKRRTPPQLKVEQRSRTSPTAAATETSQGNPSPVALRTSSELPVRAARPVLKPSMNMTRQLGERGGVQSAPSPREQLVSPTVTSPSVMPLRSTSPIRHSNGFRPEDVTPVSEQKVLQDSTEHASHPSNVSASSLESGSSSNVRDCSARSSAATSQASSSERRPSETPTVESQGAVPDVSQADTSPQRHGGLQHDATRSEPTKPRGLGFSRPRPPEPLPQSDIAVSVQAPESPMDPAVHRGGLESRVWTEICQEKDKSVPQRPSKTSGTADQTTLLSPKNGRPMYIPKVVCRGCGEAIIGKFVKAADGRLTGRYHKHCFVCNSCRKPFQTADFYVIDNHPYCERHYHELNDSLCRNCDGGIEGQYLETQSKHKYHPRCFKCRDCRQILSNDYYELGADMFYCELHALRTAQSNNFFGRERRNPERRTTRLMVMVA